MLFYRMWIEYGKQWLLNWERFTTREEIKYEKEK